MEKQTGEMLEKFKEEVKEQIVQDFKDYDERLRKAEEYTKGVEETAQEKLEEHSKRHD